jgi:branched-chain amino acid transport system ATP-binding protein
MLRAEEISVSFGAVQAVRSISLDVSKDELLGIVGPNGSGKTTFLNALCGIVPASGRLVFDDRQVRLGNPHAIWSSGITRVFQAPQVVDSLTCLENVLIGCRHTTASGLSSSWRRIWLAKHEHQRWQAAIAALDQLGIAALAHDVAGTISYGQKRLVEVARAIVGQPRLMLLDEPSAGLNDAETASLAQQLIMIRQSGTTLIVVDHKIDFLESICTRIAVFHLGKLVASGPPGDVWKDELVVQAYLGVADHA